MDIEKELLNLKDEAQAKHLMRFFKTQKGQYGEGDKFLGIKVPNTRIIAKKYYKNITTNKLQDMLENEYHEIRLCALLMMVLLYKENKEEILDLYLKNTKYINNWDLVDLTAPKIVGANFLETGDDEIIKTLANSNHLWSERIAIVAQLSILKDGKFDLLLELSEKFLSHRHDLIHKAVGWMLREAGKKDESILLNFLDKHAKIMPRTTLRYAIERLSDEKRQFYMKK